MVSIPSWQECGTGLSSWASAFVLPASVRNTVYGTSSSDLVLQLRKRRIEKVILAGPAGNLCVEAHLRDFLEQGVEVAMVRDATAGTTNEEGDGYQAALVNFRFLAHALWTTRHTVGLMNEASATPAATRAAVTPLTGRLTG